eukprot:m51a1_g1771 putative nuclear transport factor 2-like (123) ;mRNA; r:316174-317052
MSNFEALGKAFVQHYYNAFGSNRASLASLYRPESMLTFENDRVMGAQNIVAKLSSLPNFAPSVLTFDVQPSANNQGALVFLTCNLKFENNVMKYCEVFNVVPIPGAPGQSFFILNHQFRIQH